MICFLNQIYSSLFWKQFGYLSKFQIHMSFASEVLLVCAHFYNNWCAENEKTRKKNWMNIKMTDLENYLNFSKTCKLGLRVLT